MLQDLRYAARMLRRSPGFTATTVATLTLGVALSTALFAVVDALFLRSLPVRAPGELVYLYWTPAFLQNPRPSIMMRADYDAFRDTPEAFSSVTGHSMWGARITIEGASEQVSAEIVSANYFDVLGLTPRLGRTFLPDEDQPGNPDLTVVISHDLWMRRFNGRQDVMGRTVTVAQDQWATREATVIGVAPEGFHGVTNPWTASQIFMTYGQATGARYRRMAVAPIARLRQGVSVEQARAIVSTKGRQLHRDQPRPNTYHLLSAQDVRMPFDPTAAVAPARLTISMMLVVALVLIVTIANVSGLMNARGLARSSEIFARRALGASALRLGLQLTMEGVLLAIASGVLGLIVAGWVIEVFRHSAPERFTLRVALDVRAGLVAAVLCLAVGLLVSLGPALQGMRARLVDPARHVTTDRVTRRLVRSGLVLLQVAVAAALAIVAVTHLTTLLEIERRDRGFEPRGVTALSVRLAPMRPGEAIASAADAEREGARARRFHQSLITGTRAIPSARAVAFSGGPPIRVTSGGAYYVAVSREAHAAGDPTGPAIETLTVSPNYFATLQVGLLAGRDFTERDTTSAPKVAIVSRALAAQLWPGEDPLARAIAVLAPSASARADIEWLEIVDVVDEVSPVLQERGAAPMVYVPLGQQWSPSVAFALVRSDTAAEIQRLKDVIAGADPRADVERIQTLEHMLADVLYSRRLATTVLETAAGIAVALSLVGLYAVVSYSVGRRVQEFGIRTTLGATRGDIVWLVVRGGLAIAVTGSLVGMALASIAIDATASLFEGMPRLGAITAIVTPLALVGLVALASSAPARRAARIDPVAALRTL